MQLSCKQQNGEHYLGEAPIRTMTLLAWRPGFQPVRDRIETDMVYQQYRDRRNRGRAYEACYIEFNSLARCQYTLAVGYGVWSSKPKRVRSTRTGGATSGLVGCFHGS